jgi:tetratricopeptide (TPR) repeat protein
MPYRLYSVFCPALIFILTVMDACQNPKVQENVSVSRVDTDPAFKTITDSIRQFPDDVSLLLRRATRLSQMGDHEDAHADFKNAWDKQPTIETGLPLASNFQILGNYEERLKILKSLSARLPENLQVERLLADAYSSNNNNEQALKTYDHMLSRDSLDAETWYERAIVLEQLKDTVNAIESLRKAYRKQSVDTYGLELAHIYAEQKNAKALQICDYILSNDSAGILIDPIFIKGIYFANIKQYTKAIEQFNICIHRDWKTTDAYLEKGMAFFQMKKFDAAAETFTMAITVSNSDPDAYFWLGRSEEALGRKSDAMANYQKAILLDRTFEEARQRLKMLDSGFVEPTR